MTPVTCSLQVGGTFVSTRAWEGVIGAEQPQGLTGTSARPRAEALARCTSFNQHNRISGSLDRLSTRTSNEVR